MKALLRIVALTAVLAVTCIASGHAVSDVGYCNIYCYDGNGGQYYYGQTYDDFDGCCGNIDSLCPNGGHANFSARYYFFQGTC